MDIKTDKTKLLLSNKALIGNSWFGLYSNIEFSDKTGNE